MKANALLYLGITLLILAFFGCEEKPLIQPDQRDRAEGRPQSPSSTAKSDEGASLSPESQDATIAEVNAQLEALGANYRLSMVEWVTPDDAEQAGQTIFANNRAKQLPHHFVPGDPRRGGRTFITYLVDQSDGNATGGLVNAQTEGAIDNAMATWSNADCSTIPIVKVADTGVDPDIRDFLTPPAGAWGTFGVPFSADIVHAGWLPRGFFDRLAPGGGGFILGVTFTFIFVSGGLPTDIDGNGMADVAFREIYYNNNFTWGIDVSTRPYDVETVALHESGHGLSQGHFGMIFRTNSNLLLHFAPFAVMNAAISRQAQQLEGTDNAGHCSIWGSWPNN